MALIKKIRERTGLLVGIIAFGLILFLVGGDILGPNSLLMGRSSTVVAEIAGVSVKIDEYQNLIEEVKYNYTLNTGRNPSENEMATIRQQAWDLLIVKIAFQKQFDELGIVVSDEELVDMVQGNNVLPEIVQAFSNPETGEFDREQVALYLQNLGSMPQQQQAAWYLFEKNLQPSRLRIKFDNLMIKSSFVTTAEAKREHEAQGAVAEVRYVYVPFNTISDSLVNITDDMMRAYITKNKEKYKSEASRSMKYVALSILPSAEDTAYIKEDLKRMAIELKETSEDSLFAKANSDGINFFATYTLANIPSQLRANWTYLQAGDVKGPYLDNGSFKLFKISDIQQDTIYAAKASHILIRSFEGDDVTNTQNKNKADSLLRALKSGADFEQLARDFSDDPSGRNGGDLGWFTTGRMVEEFEKAVFSMSGTGLYPNVVKTQYGYHIIKVTEAKNNQSFKIATVEREIYASDETRDEAFRRADLFAGTTSNLKEFEENAAKDNLMIFTENFVGKDDRRINNLGNAREIVRWLFNDASIGKVSQVFETDEEYVIAIMTGEVKEGTSPLSLVRDEVRRKVEAEEKGKLIVKKLSSLSGTLEEIAQAYGEGAQVYSSSDLKLSTNSLPNVGFSPVGVGTAFGLKPGSRSVPFTDESGVLIIELENLTNALEVADYSIYKDQLLQRIVGRVSFDLSEAVKEFANIEDKRHRFY